MFPRVFPTRQKNSSKILQNKKAGSSIMKNKKKSSGGLIAGIIIFVVCIIGLILAGSITVPLLKTLVTIGIIVLMVVIALSVLIIAFARKASSETAAPASSVSKNSPLTKEQSDSLNEANSLLTNTRMTLSRIQDKEVSEAGIKATASIEKVLQALREKPEKIQTTRQLFNYYLPTMDKVVTKYQRIEASGVDNPDMPDNLKNYFANIDSAMENLYEGLYDNDKLNVAVDMEAMTIAIKRDGLLDEEDFKDLSADETLEIGL